MTTEHKSKNLSARELFATVLIVAVVIGGFLALQFFVRQLLRPDQLGALSLPVVAFVAGVAATFNPCGLPALPGLLASMGGDLADKRARHRASMSLAASLGAMSLVLLVGVLVAVVGEGTKDLIKQNFRWVQLAIGLFLVVVAGLHLLDKTQALPFVGPIMGLGSRVWTGAMNKPTARNSYLFGAGYVLVGVG